MAPNFEVPLKLEEFRPGVCRNPLVSPVLSLCYQAPALFKSDKRPMPPSSSSNDHPVAAEKFYRADLKTGVLALADGRRVTAFSIDFIQSLHLTLLEQWDESAQDILYRSGYEWGLREMVRLNQELRTAGRGGVWETDVNLVFRSWWHPLRDAGWGTVTFDFTRLSRGITVAELKHSVVASALAGTDQPVCHFYAGLFGGGLSFFERAERHASEMQCGAMGHPSCTFIIAPGAAVDAAESARQKGTAVADIVRRLG